MANLKDLVNELIIPDLRENALHVLSKRRDLYHEIAPLLWNTACVVTVFLQVAMFVVQKVLANDNGLEYICSTAERFFAVAKVLEMVLGSLEEQPSPRLLKYVISSYSRLSHNHRAGIALVRCIPNTLMDATFINYIREDPETLKLMDVLHGNIRSNQVSSEQGGNGVEDTGGR
ncbi:CCR4-NOT transcription complex subunit [Trifolium repens]|nr:CCR4-NOT transcription complex subunit [Trifolium repens]